MRNVYRGLMRSMAYKFFIPLIILNGVIYTIIFKFRFAVDIIILLMAGIAIMPFIGKMYLSVPFSMPIDESNRKDSFWRFLLYFGIVAVLAALHFFSRSVALGIWIYTAVLLTAIIISWRIIPEKINSPS